MSTNYGYINARVRGLKSQLLGPEFYTEALGVADFDGFTTALAGSSYGRDVEEARAQFGEGLQMVDSAIGRNFYNTTRGLLNLSSGTPNTLISILLLRYDLENLKAIARAKHAERSAEDIGGALFPAGKLKPSVLDTLANTPDLQGVAQALSMVRHPLSRAFNRAVADYGSEGGDLYGFELALDRAYYKAVMQEMGQAPAPADFRRHIQRGIDATNIRTAFKVAGQENAGELFVRGGREISRSIFDGLVTGNTATLAGTGFSAAADAADLSDAEGALREVMATSSQRLHNGGTLGIGVVLNYLRLKEDECAKLRLIARGKYYGVNKQMLEREMARG